MTSLKLILTYLKLKDVKSFRFIEKFNILSNDNDQGS